MPHRVIRSADQFRGTFLFLAGLMFLPVSIGYLFQDVPLNTMHGLEWMPEIIHLWHFGAVFAPASLTATIVGLFSRQLAHKPQLIGYGYAAAVAPPLIATGVALVALLHGAPPAIWFSIVTHGSLAAAIYLASEWPNPAPKPPKVS